MKELDRPPRHIEAISTVKNKQEFDELFVKIKHGRRLSRYHKNYLAFHVVEKLIQEAYELGRKEERERIKNIITTKFKIAREEVKALD
jgi:hypothetical protein